MTEVTLELISLNLCKYRSDHIRSVLQHLMILLLQKLYLGTYIGVKLLAGIICKFHTCLTAVDGAGRAVLLLPTDVLLCKPRCGSCHVYPRTIYGSSYCDTVVCTLYEAL